MRVADWHRRAASGRVLLCACAVAVTLIVTAVVGAAGGTPGGQHLVLALAVAIVLTTALLSSARTASPVVRVRTAATGASGHIDASTAYWCALAAPRRPQRPRAPGHR